MSYWLAMAGYGLFGIGAMLVASRFITGSAPLFGWILLASGAASSLGLIGYAVAHDALEFASTVGGVLVVGWDQHWRTERYGDPDHPFLTFETAEALMNRGARLVGNDSVNVDDTTGGTHPAHTALLEAGIPIIEHLTGLDRLVGVSIRFFAVPPKVRGMGSFPVRAFAILT